MAGDDLLPSPGWMARGEMNPLQFHALVLLRQPVVPPTTLQDPLVVSDGEASASRLARHGVERGWSLAAALAGAGVEPAWCEEVAKTLPVACWPPGLRWVASTETSARPSGSISLASHPGAATFTVRLPPPLEGPEPGQSDAG